MKKICFNENWEYREGCPGTKEGSSAQWKGVTLPHDACIGLLRRPDAESGGAKGYFPNGAFIYRKRFFIPKDYDGKCVSFFFEGAYHHARIWINGVYAGQSRNGYMEFCIPAAHLLKYGEYNEIQAALSTGRDSRWYSGAGLYRSVYMLIGSPLHIPYDGVRITTCSADRQIAALELKVTLKTQGYRGHTVQLITEITDMYGNLAAKDERVMTIYGNTSEQLLPRIYVKDPQLWDCEHPALYQCRVRVMEEGEEADRHSETFGIRKLELDPIYGLRINGKTVKLYGGCIHHDTGITGGAENRSAAIRRIRRLKSAGYNAVRSAHHPMSRTLLEACDQEGMLVMDELCDMWNEPKLSNDFSADFEACYEEWVRVMVAKDYNHPSVILYSIGNEIPESGKPSGGIWARRLSALTKKLDSSRFTTSAVNALIGNIDEIVSRYIEEEEREAAAGDINNLMTRLGCDMRDIHCLDMVVENTRETMEATDIAGYNYAERRYVPDTQRFTNRICLGTEAVPQILAENWELVSRYPNVLGDFSWTAWDYLGEAGIGKNLYTENNGEGFGAGYPYYLANCGDFDIIGERRTQSFYREVVIGRRKTPYIAVINPCHYGETPIKALWSWSDSIPSWNWEGCEGRPVQIEVYSDAEEVELSVNGTSFGRKTVCRRNGENSFAYCTVFEAVYQPGTVEAAAYTNGLETGRCAIETAEAKLHLEASTDQDRVFADTMEMVYILIELKDQKGRVHRNDDRRVTVEVSGNGILQGLGSSDPVSEERFTDSSFLTYHGQLLAAVRPVSEGKIEILIRSEGLEDVHMTLFAEEYKDDETI